MVVWSGGDVKIDKTGDTVYSKEDRIDKR